LQDQVGDTDFLPSLTLLFFAINFQVLGRPTMLSLVVKHGHGLLLYEFIEVILDESLVLGRDLANLLQHQ
jgi:hypothetical protein